MNNDINIDIGTLYDINKTAISREKPLSEKEIDEKLEQIKAFCISRVHQYYMLLNREKYDFTLFNFGNDYSTIERLICTDLKECLQNRGEIISIDLTEDKEAYEIWLEIDNEAFVYYFFSYDQGVIE